MLLTPFIDNGLLAAVPSRLGNESRSRERLTE